MAHDDPHDDATMQDAENEGNNQADASAEDHPTTVDLLSLVSWGDGSAPSLPSVDDQYDIDSDRDSALGTLRSSSTMSVRSSIYEFVEENGRTYHRYKAGLYHLPNDSLEQDRLDLQHALFLFTTHGKLFFAPISDNPTNVLDIATGTGVWAIEFAQQFPSAQVVGTDLSPIQPNYVPPNCRFEIDDAEDEWTFSQKFDFVHGRALLSCFDNPAYVIRQAFDSIKPGGYIEFQDGCFPFRFLGGVASNCALAQWNDMILQGALKLGRDWTRVSRYKDWFREAGFVDVVERWFYWPTSPWAKGEYYKTISAFFQEDMLKGLDAISLKTLGALGWSLDEMQAFLPSVRRDWCDPQIHCYFPVIFIHGRKPLN